LIYRPDLGRAERANYNERSSRERNFGLDPEYTNLRGYVGRHAGKQMVINVPFVSRLPGTAAVHDIAGHENESRSRRKYR
jgi:hypothetical protein